MTKIYSDDYYAENYFNDSNLEHLDTNVIEVGTCCFCGGPIMEVGSYDFRNKKTGEKIRVFVSALYGECAWCGAV